MQITKKPIGFPNWGLPVMQKKAKKFSKPAHNRVSVEFLKAKYPTVTLSAVAHSKMWALVQECKIEIGWLSSCRHLGGDKYIIDDVFVPSQECSQATTLITSDGEAGMLEELMLERKYDVINSLDCWGHSHVNMSVFASHIDETQTYDFIAKRIAQKKNYFIRLIANKHGEMFCSLYVFDTEMNFHYLPILIEKDTGNNKHKEWAKKEIATKVKMIKIFPRPHLDDEGFSSGENWWNRNPEIAL